MRGILCYAAKTHFLFRDFNPSPCKPVNPLKSALTQIPMVVGCIMGIIDSKPEANNECTGDETVVGIRIKGSDLNSKRHDHLLIESIDEALVDLLGHRAREAIYDYLERRCYMAREEIPFRLDEFSGILEANFGKGGRTIERTIAKRYYSRLEKPFVDNPTYSLVQFVQKANSRFNPGINVPITTTTITTSVVDASQL